ncbi:protein CLEC16A-like [Pelomyxa schiedti]|nr:protein CLEC16A-like [Pelomyxa schiedti]
MTTVKTGVLLDVDNVTFPSTTAQPSAIPPRVDDVADATAATTAVQLQQPPGSDGTSAVKPTSPDNGPTPRATTPPPPKVTPSKSPIPGAGDVTARSTTPPPANTQNNRNTTPPLGGAAATTTTGSATSSGISAASALPKGKVVLSDMKNAMKHAMFDWKDNIPNLALPPSLHLPSFGGKLPSLGINNAAVDRFSVPHLKELFKVYQLNGTITLDNFDLLISTTHDLAEVLLWGDKNDPTLFEFFMEKNMLGYLFNLARQGKYKAVAIQVLQSLSILIENLKTDNAIFYILSNNHINDMIIAHNFDFAHEEVLAYYMSFLKVLSLKLDNKYIQFFFNEKEKTFALYTQAISFVSHPEPMIRTAVRVLTMNVFKLDIPSVRSFILSPPASIYFEKLVAYIASQCIALDELLIHSQVGGTTSRLESHFVDLQDTLYYVQDLFNLEIVPMNKLLAQLLINFVIGKVCTSVVPGAIVESRLSPAFALFVLTQVALTLKCKALFTTLVNILFHVTPSTPISLSFKKPLSPNAVPAPLPDALLTPTLTRSSPLISVAVAPNPLRPPALSNPFRETILSYLSCDDPLFYAASTVLFSFLQHPAVLAMKSSSQCDYTITVPPIQIMLDESKRDALPDTSVKDVKAFVVQNLCRCFLNGTNFSMVTLQLAVNLFKTPFTNRISSAQIHTLKSVYYKSLATVADKIQNASDYFIDIYEDAIARYKRIRVDDLISDVSTLIPKPQAKGNTLSHDADIKEMEVFLALRDIKNFLCHEPESPLPISKLPPPSVSAGDSLYLDPSTKCVLFTLVVPSSKKSETKVLIILEDYIIIGSDPISLLDSKIELPSSPDKKPKSLSGGTRPTRITTIEKVVPLHGLQIERVQPVALRVVSPALKWTALMQWSSNRMCAAYTQELDKAQKQTRTKRVQALSSLLEEAASHTAESTASSSLLISPLVSPSSSPILSSSPMPSLSPLLTFTPLSSPLSSSPISTETPLHVTHTTPPPSIISLLTTPPEVVPVSPAPPTQPTSPTPFPLIPTDTTSPLILSTPTTNLSNTTTPISSLLSPPLTEPLL